MNERSDSPTVMALPGKILIPPLKAWLAAMAYAAVSSRRRSLESRTLGSACILVAQVMSYEG